jgi:RNA polymerase sigma factor (sigma-70 family)
MDNMKGTTLCHDKNGIMQSLTERFKVDSDLSVIQKILSGEDSLFEVLIRRYNPVLYKIARSYGFNHQDAEDLMQDAHVAAFMALSDFEGRASYKTWISTIMVNKCLYKLKYGYFKNEFPSDDIAGANNQSMPNNKENATEAVLLNRELASILEKSLENIPVIYRTVFMFREIEGFSVQETAAALKISPVNVKVRLNRAKSLLQKQIELFYSHNDLYAFNLIYCDAMVQKVFEKISMLRNQKSGPQ